MPYTSRSRVNRYSPPNRFPAGIKWLLIANVGLFVLLWLLGNVRAVSEFASYLTLIPVDVVRHGYLWQLVTYLFLHSGISHILWNMLALWMFGVQIERLWGTPRFLRFYFLCGIIAGLTDVAAAYVFGGTTTPTVGSSGAIYGLLVAFAVAFPDSTILFGFLIPMKSKYFVMIIGAIVFLQSYMSTVSGQPGSGVAVFAHLGGLVAGYLLLRGGKLRIQVRQPVVSAYRDWKLNRAKRKFEVYLRKQQNSDRNRRVQ